MSISTGTLGSLRAHALEHLHAVHVRHRQIGEDDVGAARLERREAARAAVGASRRRARRRSSTASSVKRSDGVVVDDEHAAHRTTYRATARRPARRGARTSAVGSPALARPGFGQRVRRSGLAFIGQDDASPSCPCPARSRTSSVPAVLLDEAARDRDAQPRAALLRREVRLADALEHLGRHARRRRRCTVMRRAAAQSLRDRRSCTVAPARRGLDRVEHEVEQRLAELARVGVEHELRVAASPRASRPPPRRASRAAASSSRAISCGLRRRDVRGRRGRARTRGSRRRSPAADRPRPRRSRAARPSSGRSRCAPCASTGP